MRVTVEFRSPAKRLFITIERNLRNRIDLNLAPN